jgi:molybdopterin-guanine dinucleotide biosynthesis protein A
MGKVTAYLGDISHKKHVVEHFQQIGELVNSYFSNSHQAWYVQTYHPELVPDSRAGQRPSIHTIGTIFEHNFQTDTQFRFEYLRWLPVELERAPELPPRAVSPLAI